MMLMPTMINYILYGVTTDAVDHHKSIFKVLNFKRFVANYYTSKYI